MLGFFAYFLATCFATMLPSRRRRLPLRVHDGYEATVLELEPLSFYFDAPDKRVDERSAEEDGDRELSRDDKRNSKVRVPNPDS